MIFLVLALTNYTADVFVSIPATDVSCLISVAAEDCRKFVAVLNVCIYIYIYSIYTEYKCLSSPSRFLCFVCRSSLVDDLSFVARKQGERGGGDW
jgi:hypothetical protein